MEAKDLMRATGHPAPFWDAVIKLGGSLCRSASLGQLLGRLAAAARRRRFLVVPGGGPFADTVRALWRKRHLSERCAHRMALLGMDQFGLLLCDLHRGARPVSDLIEARRAARAGRLPVLLASRVVLQESRLKASWSVTSDTVAAWVAARAGARRLILLKSVQIPRSSSAVSARWLTEAGIVDRAFARVSTSAFEVWVVNGQRPNEVERLLGGDSRDGIQVHMGRIHQRIRI